MPSLHLLPFPADGALPETPGEPPALLLEIVEHAAATNDPTAHRPPWTGYLAVAEGTPVGLCAFKTPPANADGVTRVEIAYVTLPGNEGRGYATGMARELVRIAGEADPSVVVAAQTLREEGPSNTILRKLGFALHSELIHPDDGEVWEWRLTS